MTSPSPSKVTRAILQEEGRLIERTIASLRERVSADCWSPPADHAQTSSPVPASATLGAVSPVPLSRILESLPLFPVWVPGLHFAKAIEWLSSTYDWPLCPDLTDLDEHPLSGLLVLSSGPGGFLFCNSDDPIPRQRFSMAHEIGHFLLHAADIRREQTQGRILSMMFADVHQGNDPEWETRERQANRFAAELLLPEGLIRNLYALAFVKKLTDQTIEQDLPRLHRFENLIAHRLLVSSEAVHFRLASLDLIPTPFRKHRPEVIS